jgi:CubicO group peptidase (beta-lactamase class C family)
LYGFLLAEVTTRAGFSAASAKVARWERSEPFTVGEPFTVDLAIDGAGELLSPDTFFDLASLTKPIVATLALALDADGILPLATELGDLQSGLSAEASRQQIADLLRHSSGLRPWAPLYALGASSCEERLAILAEQRWWGAAPFTYSDLGYILYGALVEQALGQPLEGVLRRRVCEPLQLEIIEQGEALVAAPCHLNTDREVELAEDLGLVVERLGAPAPGRAQDGNARFLGGAPGHAGLFGTAAGVAALAREWLAPGDLLDPGRVAFALAGDGPWALGWRRGALGLSTGFSHQGFTGGMVVFDPGTMATFVLLGHRVDLRELEKLRRGFVALAGRLAERG